jgi:ERCC4-type nuclease
MLIKIDYRETDLLNKITALNDRPTLTVQSANLPLGDIIICTNEGIEKLMIERKTLADLAASIRDGRYKEQGFRLNECNVPNHNIVYLIEGNLQTYRPYISKANVSKARAIDKYALMSAFVSITYYKGFSLYKANNLEESAEWLLQTAYKLEKEGGHGFYAQAKTQADAQPKADAQAQPKADAQAQPKALADPLTDIEPVTDPEDKYSTVVKRTKKTHITLANIGEIMLGQIPNVSCVVAIAVMEKFKTMKGLIEALTLDKNALNSLVTINKAGQPRKINKTSIANIYTYLLAPPV